MKLAKEPPRIANHFGVGHILCFSGENLRNSAWILACLNKFYNSEKDISKNMIYEYHMRVDNGLLNHLVVSLRLGLK